jgi:hypothetical protein
VLPTPEVIIPPAPPIPRQRVFLLQNVKWNESGVQQLAERSRVRETKHLRRGAPPDPTRCHDLDSGGAEAGRQCHGMRFRALIEDRRRPSCALRDRAATAPPGESLPGVGGVLARVAYHEASHAVIGRVFGFPIAVATIVSGPYFAGQVRASDSDPESPEDIVADATARCAQAIALLPAPGEPREDIGPWLAHTQARVIELVAGREGEKLAGYDSDPKTVETDFALARLYAGTVCISGAAISSFIGYCSAEARELLKVHWRGSKPLRSGLSR